MRSLQVKINHNIFFTNEKLFKMNPPPPSVKSASCTFCDEPSETLLHLFAQCPVLEPLWIEIQRILNRTFSHSQRILGTIESDKDKNIQNHLMLILKYYIHICRIKIQVPAVIVLRKRILYNAKIEAEIASNLGLLDEHFAKWGDIIEGLD